jgi:hypothetical protein
MNTNACYLCTHPFGLIRHRQGSKQFCSKKCLDEWRAGTTRAPQASSQQQERQRRFGTGSPGVAESPSRRG